MIINKKTRLLCMLERNIFQNDNDLWLVPGSTQTTYRNNYNENGSLQKDVILSQLQGRGRHLVKTRQNYRSEFYLQPELKRLVSIVYLSIRVTRAYIFIEFEIEVNPQQLGSINNHRRRFFDQKRLGPFSSSERKEVTRK